MKLFLAAAALVFMASCAHKDHHGDHKHKDGKACCAGKHEEGKMCGGHGDGTKKADHKMEMMDTDKDGKVSKAEFEKKHEGKFAKMDKDSDGFLSKEELESCGCGQKGEHKH